jgi:hypothetical protein
MLETVRQVIEEVRKLEESTRGSVQTALITYCILTCLYYLVVGTVAWLLGRRIIQAIQASVREARRERV